MVFRIADVTPLKATVDYRKEAKPGDKLWVWDSWRPRDRTPGAPFERGVFILREVKEVSRVSVIIQGAGGFNIKTGIANRGRGGLAPFYSWAGGEADRMLYRYDLDRHRISHEVIAKATPDQLKRIAEILGFVPEDPPNAR